MGFVCICIFCMHIQMPSLPGQVDTGRRIAVGALDELHVSLHGNAGNAGNGNASLYMSLHVCKLRL